MTAHHDDEFAQRLDALDSGRALRVARLVLECNASLPIALAAVEDADRQAAGIALPAYPAEAFGPPANFSRDHA